MDQETFYLGYRDRLESKLQYKISQIARTERLLGNLPESQKPAFRGLLAEAIRQRDEIESELDQLHRLADQYSP
jgi:hypothetical protein